MKRLSPIKTEKFGRVQRHDFVTVEAARQVNRPEKFLSGCSFLSLSTCEDAICALSPFTCLTTGNLTLAGFSLGQRFRLWRQTFLSKK